VSLTVKQAAVELGISPALVYALVHSRKIRHERHDLGRGTIRIPETALDEYRRSREFGAEDPRPAPEKRRGRLTHLRLR
jgi:excisionase family DNA binding protein